MKIWLDGGLQDTETARVSVFDHGLTVGDGIFETLKTVDGRPFALTRHLDRLTLSARGLGLPDPDHDEVRRACAAVLDANPMPLGRLRITYTGGHGPLGSDRGEHGPTLVVALGETGRRPDSTAAITVPWTRNERGALTGLKTTSYAENVVALAYAAEHGAGEALFGNLAGITRALLVEWCDVVEVDEPLEVLTRADEVFLASTTRDVQAVHRVDDRELPGTAGPVTAKAMRIFAERAGDDLDP